MVFEKFKSRYIKRIIARSFTLSQLIKDDKWNTIFSNYPHLRIWTVKICNHDISKKFKARSFKLYQLTEDIK